MRSCPVVLLFCGLVILGACTQRPDPDPPVDAAATLPVEAFAGAPGASDLAQAADYVGLRHPPLPMDVHQLGGSLLDPGAEVEFSLHHVRDAASEMLWLELLTHRGATGEPFFEVVAVLRLPPLGEHESLREICRVGDVVQEGGDGRTIAVVRAEDPEVEVFDQVLHAWRIDLDARRFVPLPTAGVQCLNEGFGYAG